MHGYTRRMFLATAPVVTFALPRVAAADARPVRFGLIADVHSDLIPDGPTRVAAFGDAMNHRKVDFVCQLGDFCTPKPANKSCLEALAKFRGDRFHVLGNHDMDGGYAREKAAAFFGMPDRYYAFERGGIRFLVLDGNDPGGKAKGYKRFVSNGQLDWLKSMLVAGEPTVVFIHQPLEGIEGVENHAEVRSVFREVNKRRPTILAVFSGHLHKDYVQVIDGVPHVQVNSASYHWMGAKYKHDSLDAAVHKAYPYLRFTCPYRDPLWAAVTIDLARGSLTIDGTSSQWVGGSPWAVGATKETHDPDVVRPAISTHTLELPSDRSAKPSKM